MKLILLILLFSQGLWAMELEHQGHRLYVEVPENWEMGQDLFGIPFIFFSPQQNGQRSNISFADTGARLELEVGALKKNQKDYQDNKKKWATTHSASIVEFYPYKSYQNKHLHTVHTIGMKYVHQKKTYVETSFYLECKGKILFSKGLRLEANAHHQKNFDSMINELDCGVL